MDNFLRQLFDVLDQIYASHQQQGVEQAAQMGPPAPPGPRDALGVPGMIQKGNIDLAHRPIAYNPDGSYSTVRSMGALVNGKETLIPTVNDLGQVMNPDEAVAYANKTNQNLGVFKDAASSERYAQNLHEDQAGQYDQMARRGDPTVGPPRPPMAYTEVGKPQIPPQHGAFVNVGAPSEIDYGQMQGVNGLNVRAPKDMGAVPGLTLTVHPDGKRTIEIPHEVLDAIFKTAPRKHKGK
jgi:hypothetical protein